MDKPISINVLNNEVFLEKECWNCRGGGEFQGDKCEYCNGTGVILTSNGEAILELIRRHGD